MKISPVHPPPRDPRPFEATNTYTSAIWVMVYTAAVHRRFNAHRENDRQPLTVVVTPASLGGRTKALPPSAGHPVRASRHVRYARQRYICIYRPLCRPPGTHKSFASHPQWSWRARTDRNDESTRRHRTRPYFFVYLFIHNGNSLH